MRADNMKMRDPHHFLLRQVYDIAKTKLSNQPLFFSPSPSHSHSTPSSQPSSRPRRRSVSFTILETEIDKDDDRLKLITKAVSRKRPAESIVEKKLDDEDDEFIMMSDGSDYHASVAKKQRLARKGATPRSSLNVNHSEEGTIIVRGFPDSVSSTGSVIGTTPSIPRNVSSIPPPESPEPPVQLRDHNQSDAELNDNLRHSNPVGEKVDATLDELFLSPHASLLDENGDFPESSQLSIGPYSLAIENEKISNMGNDVASSSKKTPSERSSDLNPYSVHLRPILRIPARRKVKVVEPRPSATEL